MVWDLEHFVLAEERVTGGTLADPCFFAGETATKEEEELQLTNNEKNRNENITLAMECDFTLWAKMKHNI
jgi:hypothetical protein